MPENTFIMMAGKSSHKILLAQELKICKIGEMAQGLRELTVLVEDPSSVSNTHTAVHNRLQTPVPGDSNTLSWPLQTHIA